ncbi:HEAT repeat domain-containing protein [Kitasatospora sp. NPDC004289]
MLTLDEAIKQLEHRQSGKRRAAALRLRRLAEPAAGEAVFAALRRELDDPRTWETQYQLVMAVGACRHQPAAGFLAELAARPFEATMVYTAIGDALTRLGLDRGAEDEELRRCLGSGTPLLVEGALRALATVRPPLRHETVEEVLDFLAPLPPGSAVRFWPAVAAVDWSGERVRDFLTACAGDPHAGVARAAQDSLAGRYQDYRPL